MINVILLIFGATALLFIGLLLGYALATIEHQKVENERLRLLQR